MKFRYQFRSIHAAAPLGSLKVAAMDAVETTVAALDKTHVAQASLSSVGDETTDPDTLAIVAFEIAGTVSLDTMRELLAEACTERGVVCIDLLARANPMVGLPGGDAG